MDSENILDRDDLAGLGLLCRFSYNLGRKQVQGAELILIPPQTPGRCLGVTLAEGQVAEARTTGHILQETGKGKTGRRSDVVKACDGRGWAKSGVCPCDLLTFGISSPKYIQISTTNLGSGMRLVITTNDARRCARHFPAERWRVRYEGKRGVRTIFYISET
jgi:hypothetical protein